MAPVVGRITTPFLVLARSLPGACWRMSAYTRRKQHVGEHRNVLVVRNLRIIRKYDANR
jgi:hypothetical protein